MSTLIKEVKDASPERTKNGMAQVNKGGMWAARGEYIYTR
jgi:hypothetical protein